MKKKSAGFFLSLCIAVATSTLLAEIPFTHIKGLHTVISPEKILYSPLNGFSWWQTGVIEGMYRNGNQNDLTIQLVRELFYLQHDSITFGPTTLNRKPASYFTPATIGKIIALIEQLPKNPATMDAKTKEQAIHQLFTTIAQDINLSARIKQAEVRIAARKNDITPFEQEKNEALRQKSLYEAALRKHQQGLRSITMKLRDAQKQGKATLTQELKQQKITVSLALQQAQIDAQKQTELVKKIEQNPDYKRIAQTIHNLDLTEKSLHHLVQLIVGSLEECTKPNSRYVPGTTQAILLSLLWKRANQKQDYLSFFSQCPTILAEQSPKVTKTSSDLIQGREILTDKTKQAQWLAWRYTKEEFEKFIPHITDAPWLTQNYEKALFCLHGQQIWHQPIPPMAASMNADYRYQSATYNFPNCVEVSLRNFLNLVLKDGDRLNIDLLRQSEKKGFKLSPALVAFYEEFFTLPALPTKLVHDAWNQVVSNLPGVTYRQENLYEIATSLDNVLKIFNHLLFSYDATFAARSKKEQLDYLCTMLSRPGFMLTWRLQDDDESEVNTKDVNLRIDFLINSDELITWSFLPEHSIILYREKIGEINSVPAAINIMIREINGYTPLKAATTLNLLNWLISSVPHDFENILEKMKEARIPAAAIQQILFGLRSHDPESTFMIIDALLKARTESYSAFDDHIHNLIKGLPTYDYYYRTVSAGSIAMYKAEAFYPLLARMVHGITLLKNPEEQMARNAKMAEAILSSGNKDSRVISFLPQLLKGLTITSQDTDDEIFETLLFALEKRYEPVFPIVRNQLGRMGSQQLELIQNTILARSIVQLEDVLNIIPKKFSMLGIEAQAKHIMQILERDTEHPELTAFKHLIGIPWITQQHILRQILINAPPIPRWQDTTLFITRGIPSETQIAEGSKLNKKLYNLFILYIKHLAGLDDTEKRKQMVSLFFEYDERISNAPLLASIAIKYSALQQPNIFKDVHAAVTSPEEKAILVLLFDTLIALATQRIESRGHPTMATERLQKLVNIRKREAIHWIRFGNLPPAAETAVLKTLSDKGIRQKVKNF